MSTITSTGTTVVFSIGQDTYETGYSSVHISDVLSQLGEGSFVRFDSDLGEVYVNPANILYVQSGKRSPRRTTASASSNSDHQRLVGGQSL